MERSKLTGSIFLILSFILVVLYYFIFRQYTELAYQGNAPEWFHRLIEQIYPRFEVEKQRFELAFFQYKADQVVIRTLLVLLTIGGFLLLSSFRAFISRHLLSYSYTHFRVLQYVFYAGLLYYTWNWYQDFEQIVDMGAFYKGVHLYKILGLEVLDLHFFYFLFGLYLLSILLVLLNIKKVFFSSLSALGMVFFQGYFFSFEKIEHTYTTLTYAALLMPFLFYELDHQRNLNLKNSFILFLIRLSIAGAYFLAGIEKILTNGFQWASAETFRIYLILHQEPLGLWIADHSLLSLVLPWMALIFQLGFIFILVLPSYKAIFLVLGIAFHWGTTAMMGIGSFLSSWIFVYVFFLDWERVGARFFPTDNSINNTQKGS